MIQSILVRATDYESDATAYAAAGAVARLFGAHVDALYVHLDPVETAVAMTTTTDGASGTLLEGIIERLERDAAESEAKARARFIAFCSQEGLALMADPPANPRLPSATFHVETGQEARWMSSYGLTSDLALAPRSIAGEETARSTLEALLLETGRPLLIPAAAPAPDFDRIAIAWKATPQTARAVAAAMPFLERASEVSILSIQEEEGRRDDTDRLVRHLAWHGITARAERLAPGADGAPATLLAAAQEKKAMLVMGGYGHTRLREWVFGGFTESVLDHADVTVLMAH